MLLVMHTFSNQATSQYYAYIQYTLCIEYIFRYFSVLRCVLASVADDFMCMTDLYHGGLVIKK